MVQQSLSSCAGLPAAGGGAGSGDWECERLMGAEEEGDIMWMEGAAISIGASLPAFFACCPAGNTLDWTARLDDEGSTKRDCTRSTSATSNAGNNGIRALVG